MNNYATMIWHAGFFASQIESHCRLCACVYFNIFNRSLNANRLHNSRVETFHISAQWKRYVEMMSQQIKMMQHLRWRWNFHVSEKGLQRNPVKFYHELTSRKSRTWSKQLERQRRTGGESGFFGGKFQYLCGEMSKWHVFKWFLGGDF